MKPLQQAVQLLIRGYQLLVSPFLAGSCRFEPTCSEYARQSVMRFGVVRGGWLSLKRISRCHPWGKWGFDPVPENHKNSCNHSHKQAPQV